MIVGINIQKRLKNIVINMPKRIGAYYKAFFLFVVIFFSAFQSYASHIFGIDLYYTWVSGNTYTIHLVVYGDCSGAAFPNLSTSVPVINVYNGPTFINSVSLAIQAPTAGVEVTPVCPADVSNTTCTNLANPIPGVKKFVYSANVTLSGTSVDWRFLFQGVMGTSSAGRSNSITNIVIPAIGSTIQLVDTLNNSTFNNSSAVYTTIPTPFFCLDIPANFNPGAVDPNGDSLVFNLVPGVDANTGSNVTYIAPSTATAPLTTAAGSFSFSSVTGQLAFNPNAIQKSLVVYNVEEYSGGVLRGTTQREMTVVVITPCSDIPPTGSMSSASAGTLTSPTSLNICNAVGPFTFNINPTDPDHNNITMTVAGLPTGATFNIVGNGTLAPTGTFAWSTTGVAPGTYIFYITYQDDGCPLSGKQTIAYTITVLPMPTEAYAPVSAATCVAKAVFHVTPGGSASPWVIKAIEGGTTVQTVTGVTGMITDSLSPGSYTIRITNPDGCYVDTAITIVAPVLPVPAVTTTPQLCPGGATGTAAITATGGLPSYTYAIGSGAYGTSGAFTGLTPGTYVLHVKDANSCEKDTTITVPDATPILSHFEIHKPFCDTFNNGYVIVTAYNSVSPYTYAIGSSTYSATDTFSRLGVGTYTFHIKNANGCIVDTTIALVDSETLDATIAIAPVLCNGGTATITISGTDGFGTPYTYAESSSAFGSSGVFTVAAGTYTFHVHDAEVCYFDTTLTITQPTPLTITPVITNVLCNGAATGSVIIIAGGGTPAYTYSIAGGAYGTTSGFTGLSAGPEIISVEDNNGCIYSQTVNVTQPTAIVIDSVSLHQPLCNAAANGSMSVYAHGGTGAYTYALSAGTYGTARTFTTLAAGIYVVHVRDANGCTKDTTVTLGQPSVVVPSAIVRPSVCHTLANGKVTLSASGGTPSYTYAMGTGTYSTTALFSPLAAGTYTFHVKDANGCVSDTSITVTDSLLVSSLLTITPAACYHQASGAVTATGTGGASPYTYSLGTGIYGTSGTYTGLPAGTDTIHIKDVNGCKADTILTIGQPAKIVPAIIITTPSCHGYANGAVGITVTGGTPAYTYSFDNSAFTATATYSSLAAGTDSILVRDAHGCLSDTTFAITQPSAIFFNNVTFTNISCYNGTDGTVTVSGTGATPPYTYDVDTLAWQINNLFSGLGAGIKLVRIKDAFGCEIDTNVTLTQPDQLLISNVDTVNATCPGYKDGSIKLYATGGTTPYAYSDDNITYGTNNSFTALAAGAYTCYARDAHSCITDTTITLLGLPQIIIDTLGITTPLCYLGTDGAITIGATGGVPVLMYTIDTSTSGNVSGTFNSLTGGIYFMRIKDSRDCFVDTAVIVAQPDSINIDTAVTPNECKGTNDQGAVALNVTGGTPPYTYLWNTTPAQTTPAIAELANGVYMVTVTDANNCTAAIVAHVVYDNCCTPFIPNAFTPNDDGVDDIFRMRVKGDMHIVVFSVYNRFGQVVYTETNTDDLDKGWNGKFNGINADLGVYYYYAKIICGNKGNNTVELKGDVTLVR